MTKYSKIKKSSFAVLALSLILVAVFAFGGTYAYFNAKASSATTTVTAGTLTLNGKYDGSGDAISLTSTSKIVPNQTIDLTGGIGAVTLGGNTVSALRIKISNIQITKVGGSATTTDENVVLSLLASDGTASTTWLTDGSDANTYYYTTAVVGEGTGAISTIAGALGTNKVGLTLKAAADNSYQGATIVFTISVEAAQVEFDANGAAGAAVAAGDAITVENAKKLGWPA